MLIRPSIRTYLVSMNMLLLGLLFPILSALFLRETIHLRDIQLERNIQTIRQALATRSSSLVRSTALSAKEAIAGFDFTFLQNLLLEVTQDEHDIRSCMVLYQDQTIIAHSDKSLVSRTLDSPDGEQLARLMATKFPPTLPTAPIDVQFFWPENDTHPNNSRVMAAIFPIYSGNSFWGVIHCSYSLESMDKQIAQAKEEWALQLQQMKRYFTFLLLGFLFAGLLIAIFLTRSFVRATQVLHSGVRQVADGELDLEISLPSGIACEEFDGLVTSFNSMTKKLRLSHQQLDEYSKSLEAKVEERTRDLVEAQGIMVQQAHEAGLAEMAVGVLHNIGNAITPAQVGVLTLSKHLTESPLRTRLDLSLAPLQDFLAGQRELTPQEKTRFGTILEHLPISIREELDFAVKELHDISDKHHHIENIIKLQMRYARLLDNPGLVDINRLTQDAVNLLTDAISKRQVQMDITLSETPLVRAEESKLLQVLVNLIKNAYEAMDACPCETRKLTIKTGILTGELPTVFFSVQDTGCGFTEEEKSRLFAFGYSTKERGSGFGLHSSANYMIANHGSIVAESPGPMLGGKFTVRLPVEQGY
ncbi:MAG: ATP-binding protein [Desulfobulbaceae bacterium]|nr:ATP-binding protein [Desulfobulbaceae bacterium]